MHQPQQATTDATPAEDGAGDAELPGKDEALGWLRLGGFMVGMAAVGASMAVFWHYFSLERLPSWPEAIAWRVPSASEPAKDDQLGRLARELEALKQHIVALDGAQQQMRAAIAALQAGHQELSRRTAPPPPPATGYWYSNPAALSLQVPMAPKRTAAVSPSRVPSGDGAARSDGAARRDNSPLKLVE